MSKCKNCGFSKEEHIKGKSGCDVDIEGAGYEPENINETPITILEELKKKQDEEFDEMLQGYFVLTDGEKTICKPREKIRKFINKVRSETAEAVAGSMVGKWKEKKKFLSYHEAFYVGYNTRIQEEQAKLEEIINQSNIKQ